MKDILPVIISGIVTGSTYGLFGLALVIIYRSTDVINFAIGDIGTVSVFLAIMMITSGVPITLALLATIIIAGLMGVFMERVLIRPLGQGRLFPALIVTIAVSALIQAGAVSIWGANPIPFPAIMPGSVSIFGAMLTIQKLFTLLFAVVAMLLVAAFFKFTYFGIAMQASAEDHFAARLIGIKSNRVASISWFLGCALGGATAFLSAGDSAVTVILMSGALFRAFAGMFLGSIHSMIGAALGGILIGLLENVAGRYISASFRDTIVFAVILIVLFLLPNGILGTKVKGGRV